MRVHDNVCVEAEVRIKPCVEVGDIETSCLGNPSFRRCEGDLMPECSFRVSQRICVQIPLTFAAIACAEPTGIVCDDPATGDCETGGCTFSFGHFKNTPSLTNRLIGELGGTVILGTEIGGVLQGLSIAATTANANDILSLNPPPPAPPDPPHKNQYANLYAQLLAAILNVQNGATCPAALTAIANANAFIGSSTPPDGNDGAPGFQTPLEQFNSGNAPGCPFHCPED